MLLALNGEVEGVGMEVLEEVRGAALSRIRFFFMLKSNVPFSSTSISAPWCTTGNRKTFKQFAVIALPCGAFKGSF